jgi:hypothetical protein
MKKKLDTRGSTLVISLIILSVLLTVGMIISNVIIRDISLNRNFSYSRQAYFAAESGLNKTLWLIKNSIFNNNDADLFQNINFSPYVDNAIDMCPDFWDEDDNCPCPIAPYNANCISSGDIKLITSGGLTRDGATYDVYMKIDYNNKENDDLNRIIYITSIGKFHNIEKKLEYNLCLGKNCI